MTLTIFDGKITQLKNKNGVNIKLTRSNPLLEVEIIKTGLYKVIPLFYYDDVTVNEGILELGEGYFITDQSEYTFTSNVFANRFNVILTVGKIDDYAVLYVTDAQLNPLINVFIEIYYSDNGLDFELLDNARTDVNGNINYQTDKSYIRFKYGEVFSDVVGL